MENKLEYCLRLAFKRANTKIGILLTEQNLAGNIMKKHALTNKNIIERCRHVQK